MSDAGCRGFMPYTRDCAQILCPSVPNRIGQEWQTCKPSPLPGKQISFSERAGADRLSGELAWWKLMSPGAATHLCWRNRHCSIPKNGFNHKLWSKQLVRRSRSTKQPSELQSRIPISYSFFCLKKILFKHKQYTITK